MHVKDYMTTYLGAQYAYFERDFPLAERMLRAGAEGGHAPSQCMLGLLHELGTGVPKDFMLALEWYHKSAAQEYPNA